MERLWPCIWPVEGMIARGLAIITTISKVVYDDGSGDELDNERRC